MLPLLPPRIKNAGPPGPLAGGDPPLPAGSGVRLCIYLTLSPAAFLALISLTASL